jgi:hypothetical protein
MPADEREECRRDVEGPAVPLARHRPAELPPSVVPLFVLVVPAQFAGALVGSLPIAVLGAAIAAHPWVAVGPVVGIGAAAGVVLGLLVRPPAGHTRGTLVVAGGCAVLGFAVLALLAVLRLPDGAAPPVTTWLTGLLVCLSLQSVLAWLLWRRSSR